MDDRDKGTPDDWVERDPRMIRETGKHPFNAEAPPAVITKSFLSDAKLAYVRNHGAVPKVDGATHRVSVSGLGVPEPLQFTLEDIRNLPATTIPLTYACSGNRRAEVNSVRPSIGIAWGPGAVLTAEFTGVLFNDFLKACRFNSDEARNQGAHFFNFAGPKNELPRGDYGTSLPLGYALDPANDVLLAYDMNGEPLLPDHGYPLRLIIPGYIGGRNIKYLSEIVVSKEESTSHYYFHDNRSFPTSVTSEQVNSDDWWFRPEYVIGEMNIVSVMTKPEHGTIIGLGPRGSGQVVELEGYAYSGGGRRIIIVELSYDDGKTWNLAQFREDSLRAKPNPYGKYWLWRIWSAKVDVVTLLEGKSITVRAWDTSFNTQPEKITWNLLGMMNNRQYKVMVHSCRDHEGSLGIMFEHPVAPNTDILNKEQARPPCEVEHRERPQVAPSDKKGILHKYTRAQVAKHSTEQSLWLIVAGKVYDVTTFVADHPGGAGILTMNAGKPCQEFEEIHSEHAHKLLEEYRIGDLQEEKEAEPEPSRVEAKTGEGFMVFLDPDHAKPCPLVSKEAVSWDTRRFRFGLPSKDYVLGLPVGYHIYLSARIDDHLIMRPYTPVTLDEDLPGFFDLVIKVYFKDMDPRFPAGGKMSQYLNDLKIGDTIDVKGPMGNLIYKGQGSFTFMGKPGQTSHFGMVAGGTGITPMLQIIQAVLKHPDDPTKLSLVFANKTPDDILLKDRLDELANKHADRFKVWYTVNRIPEEHGDVKWPYDIGFINENMFQAHLPPHAKDHHVLLCGPPPMVRACGQLLDKIGFDQDHYFAM